MVTRREHRSCTARRSTFDPDDYEVKQVFYTSKDGTRVPMFLAHKKGIELDGTTRRSCTATAASTSR